MQLIIVIKSLITFFICFIYCNSYAQNTILNGGFELGTDSTISNWSSFDGSARIDSLSNSGNYSMKCSNWYAYAEGNCVNGNVEFQDQFNWFKKGGTPFIYKPSYISGYYKYDTTQTFSVNDSAIVEVYLKKFNNISQVIDTIGIGITNLPATNPNDGFVEFEVHIDDLISGINPDSIVIRLRSSKNGFCNTPVMDCLHFYVDDISAHFPLDIKIPVFQNKIKVWPNPVKKELNIDFDKNTFKQAIIFDTKGEVVFLTKKLDLKKKLDVSKLNKGTYFLYLESQESTSSIKFVKK